MTNETKQELLSTAQRITDPFAREAIMALIAQSPSTPTLGRKEGGVLTPSWADAAIDEKRTAFRVPSPSQPQQVEQGECGHAWITTGSYVGATRTCRVCGLKEKAMSIVWSASNAS